MACSGAFEIVLEKGASPSVTLTGTSDQLAMLATEVNGRTLYIRTKENGREWIQSDRMPSLRIVYTDLEDITSSGSSTFTSEGKLLVESVTIRQSGSGSMNFQIEGAHVKTTISGSGKVVLAGKVSSLKVNISGSGAVKAMELEASVSSVQVSGSGEADVQALDQLNVAISGSGRVRYAGNPAKIEQHVSGSGKVTKVK